MALDVPDGDREQLAVRSHKLDPPVPLDLGDVCLIEIPDEADADPPAIHPHGMSAFAIKITADKGLIFIIDQLDPEVSDSRYRPSPCRPCDTGGWPAMRP